MKSLHVIAIYLITALASSNADTFPVAGGGIGGKRIVVSYDPKEISDDETDIEEPGANLLLVDGTGKTIAEFPQIDADWSWAHKHPEHAIYEACWNHDMDLVYIVYQAGRIATGFDVFRFDGDKIVPINIGTIVAPLYEKAIIGHGPRSPNNSGCHPISWLGSATLLVDLNTANDLFYATISITKRNKPRLTNLFNVSEPADDDEPSSEDDK